MIPSLVEAVNAETERRTARVEAIIRAAVSLEGAGCRSIALAPPDPMQGRGIVTLHEWPRLRLIRRTACYCGAERK